MNPIIAIVLGIVQGVTEFLPVSSSGHLVLAQHLLGLDEPLVFFDVMLHVGTLAALCAFYWRELVGLVGVRVPGALATPYTAVLIGLGCIPTGVIGLLGRSFFTGAFGSMMLTSFALVATGCVLWTTRYPVKRRRPAMGMRDALVIGGVQGFAIMPGISRSGTTIAAGLWLGLDRDMAARYSFLLAVPAILAAVVLEWEPPAGANGLTTPAIVAGTAAAGVSGYVSLAWLVRLIQQGGFWKFAPYCWFIGGLGILLASQAAPPTEGIEAHGHPRERAAAVAFVSTMHHAYVTH